MAYSSSIIVADCLIRDVLPSSVTQQRNTTHILVSFASLMRTVITYILCNISIKPKSGLVIRSLENPTKWRSEKATVIEFSLGLIVNVKKNLLLLAPRY